MENFNLNEESFEKVLSNGKRYFKMETLKVNNSHDI